jgi:hypothetical protein
MTLTNPQRDQRLADGAAGSGDKDFHACRPSSLSVEVASAILCLTTIPRTLADRAV